MKDNKPSTNWGKKIDKSGLSCQFKAWIYQHAILPRVLWPLLQYEVSLVEKAQKAKIVWITKKTE